jgi:hypothetical protein
MFAKIRISAVLERDFAAGFGPEPDQPTVGGHIAAHVTERQASGGVRRPDERRRAAVLPYKSGAAKPGRGDQLQKLSPVHFLLTANFIP